MEKRTVIIKRDSEGYIIDDNGTRITQACPACGSEPGGNIDCQMCLTFTGYPEDEKNRLGNS